MHATGSNIKSEKFGGQMSTEENAESLCIVLQSHWAKHRTLHKQAWFADKETICTILSMIPNTPENRAFRQQLLNRLPLERSG